MQVVLWAFGSMLVFLFILAFLPIGFTLKGKFITVFAGLVLALAGLLATTVLPILQTVLILVLLVLSTAYILNRRLESVLYSKTASVPEFMDEGGEDLPVYESSPAQSSIEPLGDMQLMGVSELTAKDSRSENTFSKTPELAVEPIQMEMPEEESLFPFLETAGQKNTAAEPSLDKGYLSEIESLLEENRADELLVIK